MSHTATLSRSEHAYRQLREGIRNGELRPGSRVRETELADLLGISRTPLREAIRRLEQEGLLETTAHKGMAVAELDYQAVIELYQMREVLEGTAASLAARLATDAEIAGLRHLLEEKKGLSGQPDQQAVKNKAFHHALYQAAHNRFLLKALASLQDAMALLGTSTYQVSARNTAALSEHDALLEAIESRDPVTAEQTARQHIRGALTSRVQMINAHFQRQLAASANTELR